MPKLLRISLLISCCATAFSCATPSSPTGGPRDEEGPKIVRTEPETETVNFEGNKIVLYFSEFVERSSFSDALVIEPELGLLYSLDWGRKSVSIEFDDDLPDLTTMIVTVGTDFSDLNGNEMASPYKVAVSTGPDIDQGKLTGRVLDARTGEANSGQKVLLYRSPVDLTLPANYIGETDTSGVVRFSYLRQGQYKAFWVNDRNRSKSWEPEQERAQPFANEFIELEKAGEDTLGTLYVAASDTSKPVLQGIGLFSSQRMRLRFSENVQVTDSTKLQIQDSTGTTSFGSAYPLYVSPAEGYVLFAQSNKPLDPQRTFRLNALNISDPAGNVQSISSQTFTGSAQEDTTEQRIIGTSIGEGIFPDEAIRIAYAEPISQAATRDSLKIVTGDSLHTTWPNLQIDQNKLRIFPDSVWKKGIEYEFRIWNPITENYKSLAPTIWQEADVGALNISFEDSASEASKRLTQLTVKMANGRAVADTSFTGSIEIERLAPVDHQARMYQDLNDNGEWDTGQVSPFKAPEPFYIRNDVPVQSGLTSDLTISFDAKKIK